MNTTITAHLAESLLPTPHRYQIYRQSRNGLHYNYGSIICVVALAKLTALDSRASSS